MNSKVRAFLRSKSQKLEVVLFIGKDGITESVIASADQAITAREMIKCCVQQNCPVTAREASECLCSELGAEGISCAGRRFVLFRPSEKNIYQLQGI